MFEVAISFPDEFQFISIVFLDGFLEVFSKVGYPEIADGVVGYRSWVFPYADGAVRFGTR